MLYYTLWLAPVLIPILSLLSFKHIPFRRQRLTVYFFIFIVATLSDLSKTSFISEIWKFISAQLIIFMLFEYLWLLSLIKIGKRAIYVLFTIAFVIYFYFNWNWIVSGPDRISRFCSSTIAGTHQKGKSVYFLKEMNQSDFIKPSRVFKLTKKVGILPLEKTLDEYRIPDSYSRSEIRYTCTNAENHIQFNIISDSTQLWTLIEKL